MRSAESRNRFWGGSAAYAVLCGVLTPRFQNILGPDTLSYLSIAQHYLHGEWLEAANTGWSPMMSWLLVPFLAVGVPGLAAMRGITIAAGFLFLYVVGKLAEDFELEPFWAVGAQYTAAGMAVAFALLRLGPDLLEAGFLLLYFRAICRLDYASARRGVEAGLWGAAAYLTKGYALYFFLAHFAVSNLLHARWNQRKVGEQWFRGMAVFVLLTLPWFAAMSYKAGRFSTGTTGAWNYRLVGPQSPGYPQLFGLVAPPGEHGSSMWEEPSPDLLPAWSPLTGDGMVYQARLVVVNIKMLVRFLLYTSVLSLLGIAGYIVCGLKTHKEGSLRWKLVVLTVVLYPAGYMLILVQDRYVWSVLILILLMGAVAVQAIVHRLGSPAWARWVGLGYFLSYLALPARMMQVQSQDDQQRWKEIATQIQQQVPGGIHGRMAGCGGWNEGMQIAGVLGAPFYGVTAPTSAEQDIRKELNLNASAMPVPQGPSPEEAEAQLSHYRVEYFLALPACDAVPASVQQGQLLMQWQGTRLFHITR